MAEKDWKISRDVEGAWTIRDPAGEVRGRFRDANMLALHLAGLMAANDRTRGLLLEVYHQQRGLGAVNETTLAEIAELLWPNREKVRE